MNDPADELDAALETIERERGPQELVSAQVRHMVPGPYPFEEITVTGDPETGEMTVSMPDPEAFQPHYVLNLVLRSRT